MKNTTVLGISIIIVMIVSTFLYSWPSATASSNIRVSNSNQVGDVQKIILGTKNYNYWPNEITVKANQPVELTLDASVVGCLRAFTIKELGVGKFSKSPEDKIIFTPTKKGNFRFACSMGMGYGTLVVK